MHKCAKNVVNEVKENAKKNLGPVRTSRTYLARCIYVKTKGGWTNFIHFLYKVLGKRSVQKQPLKLHLKRRPPEKVFPTPLYVYIKATSGAVPSAFFSLQIWGEGLSSTPVALLYIDFFILLFCMTSGMVTH